ncbi:transposase, partial [Microbulbifer agarilyticus]|uniref:transposase n=1 Tax=Microbulbifer agarilyticus TaxID=260552 RepID=UPI0021BC1496
NRYDDDFKATAVSLTDIPGVLAKHVAEALDIHEVMLYRWRMEMRRGQIMAKKKNIHIDPEIKSELKRLRKLEREHNLLQEEHSLLKKAIQFSLQQKGKSSSS